MSHIDKEQKSAQEWFTPAEAAEYLRVTRQTIYRYMKDGLLPYYKLKTGRGRRIRHADILNLLDPPPATQNDSES